MRLNPHRFLFRARLALALVATGAPAGAAQVAQKLAAPLTIDGRLDEADWSRAQPTAEFAGPLQPDGFALPAVAPTRVRMLWDEHALYFGFECEGAPAAVTLREHDAELHREEVVEVFLDLAGEGTDYVELQLSPAGVTADLRHHWSRRPTYSATHIDEGQRRALRSDREWNLAGWRAAASPRIENGAVTGWTAELAVPVAALGAAREKMAAGDVFRANFAHYRFPNGETLRPATWRPVILGRVHASPMAMGAVRCVESVPASAGQAAWRDISRLLVADAHRAFREDESASREARFGVAMTLLNVQPRSEANIAEAGRLLTQLSTGETDEFAFAARYYLGRIEQVHRFTPDPARAKAIFEELMREHPASLYAQLAGVKVCLLTLYAPGVDEAQRLAAGEQLADFFTLPEAKRDYHLAMADAHVRLGGDDRRLLAHLLAADGTAEMSRPARADLYARVVDAATRVGDRRLAIDYCHRFLALRLRAARVALIAARLRELEAAP